MERRLPASNLFENSVFNASASPGLLAEAIFSTPHVVTSKFRDDEVMEGTGTITYKIDVVDRNPTDDFTVSNHMLSSGTNASENVDSFLTRYGSYKTTVQSYIDTNSLDFDYTLVLNLIGRLLAASTGGVNIAATLQNSPLPDVGALSDHQHQIEPGSILIGRNLAATVGEFNFLLALLRTCGVRIVYTVTDQYPQVGGGLTNDATISYLWRLAGIILTEAAAAKATIPHMHALWRGMTHMWSLNAHSDEGGGIRDPLARFSGPPVRGVVTTDIGRNTESNLLKIPLAMNTPKGATWRSMTAFYFDMVRCHLDYHNTDSHDHVHPVVLTRTGAGNTYRDFENYAEHFGDYIECAFDSIRIYYKIEQEKPMFRSHSFPYFRGNARGLLDVRHFGGDVIAAFSWVEAVGLNSSKDFRKIGVVPGTFGERDTLPFFDSVNVGRLYPYGETSRGAPQLNSMMWLDHEEGKTYRHHGMSYLLSPRYNRMDGLAGISFGPTDPMRRHITMPIFSNPAAGTIAQSRWVTPHNPLPHPIEGLAAADCRLLFSTTRGRGFPNVRQMRDQVEFEVGVMAIAAAPSARGSVSHRDFPPELKPYVAKLNKYTRNVAFVGYEYQDIPAPKAKVYLAYDEFAGDGDDGPGPPGAPDEDNTGNRPPGTRGKPKSSFKKLEPSVAKQKDHSSGERKVTDTQKPPSATVESEGLKSVKSLSSVPGEKVKPSGVVPSDDLGGGGVSEFGPVDPSLSVDNFADALAAPAVQTAATADADSAALLGSFEISNEPQTTSPSDWAASSFVPSTPKSAAPLKSPEVSSGSGTPGSGSEAEVEKSTVPDPNMRIAVVLDSDVMTGLGASADLTHRGTSLYSGYTDMVLEMFPNPPLTPMKDDSVSVAARTIEFRQMKDVLKNGEYRFMLQPSTDFAAPAWHENLHEGYIPKKMKSFVNFITDVHRSSGTWGTRHAFSYAVAHGKKYGAREIVEEQLISEAAKHTLHMISREPPQVAALLLRSPAAGRIRSYVKH